MNKSVERQINQIYNKVFNTVFNRTRLAKLAKGSKVEIMNAVKIMESSVAYNKFADKFAKELAKKGLKTKRGVWRKYYNVAKRLQYVSLPKTYTEYEATIMSKAVKHNFTMIKSIPAKTLNILEHKYTSTLIEEVAKGSLNRGSFQKQLETHAHKNAKLIARTETAKLQTAIMETRARDLGSVAYIWRSSNDKRTRQSHKDMNGVVVFWRLDTQKPLLDDMRGNAGEFPNCRCDTAPILDEDDLKSSTYKVYDYRSDKVINLNRAALIKALNDGFLS